MGHIRTYLDTVDITGTSPGRRMQYETLLYVMPTSNARANFGVHPSNGFLGFMKTIACPKGSRSSERECRIIP